MRGRATIKGTLVSSGQMEVTDEVADEVADMVAHIVANMVS